MKLEFGLVYTLGEGESLMAARAVLAPAMGPKLRAQGNANNELVALLEIDDNGNCDISDQKESGETLVVVRGTPPVGSILEIPVAGSLGLGIFATALLLLSEMWVRSRAAGVQAFGVAWLARFDPARYRHVTHPRGNTTGLRVGESADVGASGRRCHLSDCARHVPHRFERWWFGLATAAWSVAWPRRLRDLPIPRRSVAQATDC